MKTTSKSELATRASVSVDDALAWLKRRGTQETIDAMARYGLSTERALGVTVADMKAYAKQIGTDHALAVGLWASGWYDARILAVFIDDPLRVTLAQMDGWAADIDNWGVCDAVCFHLFDRTPHAWKKARQWTKARPEYVKRAGLALFWSLSAHDKAASDAAFLDALLLVERAAADERDMVKKGASMALRAIGKRNAALNAAAVEVAGRMAASQHAAARWVGKTAYKELTSAGVQARIAKARTTAPRRARG